MNIPAIKDNYIKYYNKISKFEDNNFEDKVLKLLSDDDAITNHIIGQVLDDLNEPDIAGIFYKKAEELGYKIMPGETYMKDLKQSIVETFGYGYEDLRRLYKFYIGEDPINDPTLKENIKIFIDNLGVDFDKELIENGMNELTNSIENKDVTLEPIDETNLYRRGHNYSQHFPYLKELSVIYNHPTQNDGLEFNLTALKNLVESDRILKFHYDEIRTGDVLKDLTELYNTQIKGDDENEHKLEIMVNNIKTVNENVMTDSLIAQDILDLLEKTNLNLDSEQNIDISTTLSELIEKNINDMSLILKLSKRSTQLEYTEKMSLLNKYVLFNSITRLNFKKENELMINTDELKESLNISDDLSNVIGEILLKVYDLFSHGVLYNDSVDTVIYYIASTIILKNI